MCSAKGYELAPGTGAQPMTVAQLVTELQIIMLNGYGEARVVYAGDGSQPMIAIAGGIVGNQAGLGGDAENALLMLAPTPLDKVGGF